MHIHDFVRRGIGTIVGGDHLVEVEGVQVQAVAVVPVLQRVLGAAEAVVVVGLVPHMKARLPVDSHLLHPQVRYMLGHVVGAARPIGVLHQAVTDAIDATEKIPCLWTARTACWILLGGDGSQRERPTFTFVASR